MEDKRGSYIALSTLDNGSKKEETKSTPRKKRIIRSFMNGKVVCTKRDLILILVVVSLIGLAVILTLSLGLPRIREKRAQYYDTTVPVSDSILHSFAKSAIVSDAEPCAAIGKDILDRGGSAVDSAIAIQFCGGVVNPQSMGLGGGFLMLVYTRNTRTFQTIDARETAPSAAYKDMYHGNGTLSTTGGSSIAVPGELRGLGLAHSKYGLLNWTELVKPSIKLCKEGFRISGYMADKLIKNQERILNEPSMSDEFMNPETRDVYKVGDLLKRPKLAETLEIIADEGPDALYNGSLAIPLIEDIEDYGGNITLDDLSDYQARIRPAISVQLRNGHTFHSVPPPGCGAILALIMSVLDGYNLTPESVSDLDSSVLTYHRMIETFKYAFAERSYLGDSDFVNDSEVLNRLTSRVYADAIRAKIVDTATFPSDNYGAVSYEEDHGTAHSSVLAANGDAVTVTSTINTQFGSMLRSLSTGIILNNEMDDFSSPNIENYFGVPPSEANFIEPGKRPLSSMSPVIITDANGDVSSVLGAAGGTRIITSTAVVASNLLWMGKNMKEAIDVPRIHHQLWPNQIMHEKTFPQVYLDHLQSLGHDIILDHEGSVVLGIHREQDKVLANIDYRKGGSVEGY